MKNQPNGLFNIPEEKVVIGKLLQNESAFWAVADVLQAQHFYKPIHGAIFQAIRDIVTGGKKVHLVLIQARIGEEYDDGDDQGLSTMTLMTALLRDAEDGDLEGVDNIIDLWRHRKFIETMEAGLKEAKKPNAASLDLIGDHLARIDEITVNSQAEPLKSVGAIAIKVLGKTSKTRDTGLIPGFDTGLPSLDEILGRIHPGDLGFIGARPGDGKSVLAAQLAMQAQLYAPAMYFQLEMTDEDMVSRMLAGKTGVAVADIEAGSFDAFELEDLMLARDKLATVGIYIDDRPKLRIDQLWDRCNQIKRSKGLGFAVVDHIRLVRANGKFQNRFDKVEYVTGELKAMGKDLGIAVLALSQVTRSSQRREDPMPTLNDFDGGSSIEQDADWALSAFRRDRWLKQQRPHDMESSEGRKWSEDHQACKGKIAIQCLKRRRGEDGEKRDFEFDGKRGLLREIGR